MQILTSSLTDSNLVLGILSETIFDPGAACVD